VHLLAFQPLVKRFMGGRGARFVDRVLVGQLTEHLRKPVGSTAAEIRLSVVGSLALHLPRRW